jgi:hypothetical protein
MWKLMHKGIYYEKVRKINSVLNNAKTNLGRKFHPKAKKIEAKCPGRVKQTPKGNTATTGQNKIYPVDATSMGCRESQTNRELSKRNFERKSEPHLKMRTARDLGRESTA